MHKCPHKLIKNYFVLSVYCLWRFKIQFSTQIRTNIQKKTNRPRNQGPSTKASSEKIHSEMFLKVIYKHILTVSMGW